MVCTSSKGAAEIETNTALDLDPGETITCVFTNIQTTGQLTDTSFCQLPAAGFRLVYLQDGPNSFRLNASNPGQFYYNVFYSGTPGADFNLSIKVAYPFITNGANPIQVPRWRDAERVRLLRPEYQPDRIHGDH